MDRYKTFLIAYWLANYTAEYFTQPCNYIAGYLSNRAICQPIGNRNNCISILLSLVNWAEFSLGRNLLPTSN